MLRMVMAKPMELTIVRAVPLDSAAALFAIRVEKSGESATTIRPQKIKKLMSKTPESCKKIRGEIIQQHPERSRAVAAVLFAPHFCEMYPPATQANPPRPMIKNERRGMLK